MQSELFSGRLPNVHWQAVAPDELRLLPNYLGLPPIDWIVASERPSYRYVRQEDPFWSLLHQGVLTTGHLPQTLGFFEPISGRKLGLPRSRVSHRYLIEAYHRLLLPVYLPPLSNGTVGRTARDAMGLEAAPLNAVAVERLNADAVVRFNAGKQLGPAASISGCSSPLPLHPALTASLLLAGASTQIAAEEVNAAVTTPVVAVGGGPAGALRDAAAAGVVQAVGREATAAGAALKLRQARSLEQQGTDAIRRAWGKAQEAASLHALSTLLPPSSHLVEVGLCQLDPRDLPPEWGFGAGTLPPLGASPDALLCHAVPAGALGSGGAAVQDLPTFGERGMSGARDGESSSESWGNIVRELLGLHLCEEAPTHPLGAAGDNGCSSQAAGGSLVNSTACSMGGTSEQGAQYVYEVVEVKNVCPFGENQRRGCRGRPPYLISDKGPCQAVKPEWVPQLQMHMLCAGTISAVLASRSATRGLRLFRMRRDDTYLALMLRVLSRVWREHVKVRQPPPPNMFSSWADYHSLLSRTTALARSARLVLAVPAYQHPPGGDTRFFLD